ncbi:MAG: hypothetical protein E7Z84_08000, partial [Methanosphaera stadtmanae]|nr:hypothetical protein [Methanosphaera stadtmanae]
MKKKGIVLIVAVILIMAIGIGAYFSIPENINYKNITMNGIIMEVPDDNGIMSNYTQLYTVYNDTKYDLMIHTFDSEDAKLNDMSEATEFAASREAYQFKSKSISKDGLSYNYSESTGIYSYVGNFTHKNVLVSTTNEEVLIHILKTMKLDPNANTTKNDTAENVTVVSQKSSSSSSSKDSDYDPQRDDSHQGATRDNPITVQQSDGEYTYYGPGHYDYYAGDNHMS